MGSTGSIGTQTLDIVRRHADDFKISALTANCNWELLAEQAREFRPEMIVIADESKFGNLKEAVAGLDVEVACGRNTLDTAASLPGTDITVCSLVGYSGLSSTIAAIKAGKTLALANKETLVVAGHIITRLAKEHGIKILPVDSEHSAIFQCLQGEEHGKISKLILTASGGPFRTFTLEQMREVKLEDALAHPNWKMGAKVTIDSATMMNKGFEMIEARWLFDMRPEDIEVVVHPQSVVHSMVEFCDGSIKAQLGVPDMRIPISYALGYPHRLCDGEIGRLSVGDYATLTFEKPDMERFPLLATAYEAAESGGNMPAIMNAANEVAVRAFIERKIGFTDIYPIVRETMEKTEFIKEISLETLEATHRVATATATEILKRHEA